MPISNSQLLDWQVAARRDDWHKTFVGSDIRQMLSEIERLRSDFAALQHALVGDTGLSAILEATRLRKLHPLKNG